MPTKVQTLLIGCNEGIMEVSHGLVNILKGAFITRNNFIKSSRHFQSHMTHNQEYDQVVRIIFFSSFSSIQRSKNY